MERAQQLIQLLEKAHPDAKIALHYSNALELLVATILSAQCNDERVNKVTESLFKKWRKAEDYANANTKELEETIRPTGFYHNKARNIQAACKLLVRRFNSEVPKTMKEILTLPGVARKTGNIALSNAYGIIEGIAVDNHVRRVSRRLGLTVNEDPDKIEKDLTKIIPREYWQRITDLLVSHGRRTCAAKKPKCAMCILNQICASAFTFDYQPKN